MRGILLIALFCTTQVFCAGLNELVSLGIENNSELKAKKISVDVSKSRYEETRSASGATLYVDLQAGRNKATSSYEKIVTTTAKQKYTSYDYGLYLSKPLFSLKSLRLEDRAEIDIKRAEVEYVQAEQEFVLKIVDLYVDAILKKKIAENAKITSELSNTKYREVNKSFQDGVATVQDMLILKAEAMKYQIDIENRENEYVAALNLLKSVTGGSYENVDEPEESIIDSVKKLGDLKFYLKSSEDSFIGHLRDEIEARLYKQDAKIANADYYPTLDLDARSTTNSTSDGVYGKTDYNRLYAGLRARWVIYNGLQRENRYATSMLLSSSVESRVAQRKKDITAETQKRYYDVLGYYSSYKATKELSSAYAVSLKAVSKGHKLGTRKLVEIYDTNDRLERSKLDEKRALLNLVSSFFRLKYYSGLLAIEINK